MDPSFDSHQQLHRRRVEGRDSPEPVPRFLPLAIGAAMLGVRLALAPPVSGSMTTFALAGFGLLAFAAILHLVALRFPGRYAVEGAAWVATVIVGFALIPLLIPAGGN
jgi:hypothetical protein